MPVTQHASSSGKGGTNSFVAPKPGFRLDVRVCPGAALASAPSGIGSPQRNIIGSVDCNHTDGDAGMNDLDSLR